MASGHAKKAHAGAGEGVVAVAVAQEEQHEAGKEGGGQEPRADGQDAARGGSIHVYLNSSSFGNLVRLRQPFRVTRSPEAAGA